MSNDKNDFVVMSVPGNETLAIAKEKLEKFMNDKPDPRIIESNKKLLKRVKNIKMVYGNKDK